MGSWDTGFGKASSADKPQGEITTADELLERARQARPDVRYAKTKNGNAIGAWNDELGRYQLVACRLVTGIWARMPYEILADNEPMYKPEDWEEEA